MPSTALARQSARSVVPASSVMLNPSSGPPGTQVTAIGSGWTSGDPIQVQLDSGSVNASTTVAGDGTFTVSFTVPANAALGPFSINFVDPTGNLATFIPATFTVTSSQPSNGNNPNPTGGNNPNPPSGNNPQGGCDPFTGEGCGNNPSGGCEFLPGGCSNGLPGGCNNVLPGACGNGLPGGCEFSPGCITIPPGCFVLGVTLECGGNSTGENGNSPTTGGSHKHHHHHHKKPVPTPKPHGGTRTHHHHKKPITIPPPASPSPSPVATPIPIPSSPPGLDHFRTLIESCILPYVSPAGEKASILLLVAQGKFTEALKALIPYIDLPDTIKACKSLLCFTGVIGQFGLIPIGQCKQEEEELLNGK
jgi:hypothetical protein